MITPSKKFHNLLDIYTNPNLSFKFKKLNSEEILTPSQLISNIKNSQYTINYMIKGMKPENFDIDDVKGINELKRENYRKCKVLNKTHPSDIVCSSKEFKWHIMKESDYYFLKMDLYSFLCDKAPILFKIKWILKHKPLSNEAFAQEIGVYLWQINRFKSDINSILNMHLDTGIKLVRYYNNYIYQKLYTK